MKKRFFNFHYKLLKPVLVFSAMLALFIVIYGQDSEEIKGKVIARVVYSFPHALPGEKIELKRVVTDSGKVITVSSSEEYRTIDDINYLKKREAELVRQKYGVLSHSLIKIYENMSDNELIKVIIRFKNSVSEDQLQILNLSNNCEIVNNYTVIDSVNKSLLSSLRFNSLINEIDKYTEPEPMSGGDENCEDCGDIQNVYTGDAYSRGFFNLPDGENMPSYGKGNGVSVATFEHGLSTNDTSEINASHPNLNWGHIETAAVHEYHTQMCFHAMLHTAPEATLNHIIGFINQSDLADYNIEVASRSYAMSWPDELEKFTYESGSAVICLGSGNDGVWSVPNETPDYNCIVTGGCVYTNNSYYEISEETIYQEWADEKWHFGTDRTHTETMNYDTGNISDKEVPHVVGPSRTTCLGGGGKYDKNHPDEKLHGFSGVSAALPSLVGICADIISACEHAGHSFMTHNTENVRTALLLTAENIDAGYWDPMVDGRDGCGVISGYGAVQYAHGVTRKIENSPADDMGLAYYMIPNDPSGLNGTRIKFNIKTPSTFPEGKHLRAVLTWSCSINANNNNKTLSNLDLELVDETSGKVIDRCYSFEDNIEVIDVPNRDLETDKEDYSLELVISNLDFGANPTEQYIKYSIGWTWVNDFAGKTIEDETFTGDTAIELLNRNIELDNNTVFENGSNASILASNRIVLNPGVEIEEGAEFTTNILKSVAKFNMNTEIYQTDSLVDLSANRRHAEESVSGQTQEILNRYCQGWSTASKKFLDGNVYYRLWGGNPEYFDGLTLSMRIKFYDNRNIPGYDASGYIFTSLNSSGDGYYLYVDDISTYFKMVTFHISGGGYQSEVTAIVNKPELEDWIDPNIPTPKYNWGWVTVTAVWKAGDKIELWVNGDLKEEKDTDVSHCPSNQCYIGADPAISNQSFRGGIGEVRLYSGADYKGHVEGVYHQHGFPGQWQSDRVPFAIDVGSNGKVDYDIDYTGDNIENLEQTKTVDPGTSEEVQVGYRFDIDFDFIPDANYQVREIILELWEKVKDGPDVLLYSDIFGSTTTSLNFTDYSYARYQDQNGDYHYYDYMKCYVTFEP